MITNDQKNQIIDALELYMELHSLSQNDIQNKADVNASYLIQMRKRVWTIKIGAKEVIISDKYFTRLADMIGFEVEEKIISTKPTPQLSFILSHLKNSIDHTESCVLVGETGCGKTFSLDTFKRRFPAEVFSIKVGSSDSLGDILQKIAEELKLDYWRGSKSAKIGLICRELKKRKERGLSPLLAWDESEYLKHASLCAYKEVYDVLLGVCPMVMLGTQELMDNIERLIRKQKPGISQLYRRLKFKTHYIPGVDTRFELFLDGIDKELKKWLQDACANYGELTDILTPCIRESRRLGQPLTLDFVKLVLSIG